MFSSFKIGPKKGFLPPTIQRSFSTSDATSKVYEIELPEKSFKVHKTSFPSLKITTTREEMLGFYKLMFRIRRLEVAADNLYKQRAIRGFCHLYNGQEAVLTGIEGVINHKDHVVTAYRDHGFMLGRGDSMKSVLAELTGRVTGCSRGKGGSMHMYKKDTNFYGGNGIVGAQVPLGLGAAFALKYQNTDRVSLAFYGDGAANQGQIFESFNMAALWSLPCIFVCENNQYAMGTSVQRGAGSSSFYTRGDFVPGIWIDGMDVLAVKAGSKHVIDQARAGKGPFVIEMFTYRYVGHSMSDPGTTYRTREEVNKIRDEKDPIQACKKRILQYNMATEDELKSIEKEAKTEVDEAVEFCKSSPEPGLHETWTNVYTHDIPVRGVELANSYPSGACSFF